MELHVAIKNLVKYQGADFLKKETFINALSDFNAFEQNLAFKNILRILIQDGFMNIYDSEDKWRFSHDKSCVEISINYAWPINIIKYILESIAYGFGYLSDEPLYAEEEKNMQTPSNGQQTSPVVHRKNTGTHLEFKGIEICGQAQDIANELNKQGYTTIDKGVDGVLLNGSFAGVQNCNILISVAPEIDEVATISVHFPAQQTWWGLKSDYSRVKEQLTRKYGCPESYEFFTDPYFEGDGYEDSALSSGKCTYFSKFTLDKGNVGLYIQSNGVLLLYTDKLNDSRIEQQKESMADYDL